MARLFPAAEEQRSVIADIVEKDAAVFFSAGLNVTIAGSASSLELMVHDDVSGPIPHDIAHGLPQSPNQISPDGSATFLSGAREVGMELATRLTTILGIDRTKVLYIPHAYAEPAEIESLQDEFNGLAMEMAGRVYIRCSGPNIAPELVRRALVSMIGGYSVAWLLDFDLPEGKPCSAVVSVFDGEGWAIFGKSVFLPIHRTN